jgi:alpha-glucosidase
MSRCRKASAAVLAVVSSALAVSGVAAQPVPPLSVSSPDGAITVAVETAEAISYRVRYRNADLVLPSRISMTLADGTVLGANPVVTNSSTRSVNEVLRPVVRYRRAEVRDHFNERRIDFAGDYSLIVRASDDGIAWRFATRLPGEITVAREEATFRFGADHEMWFP